VSHEKFTQTSPPALPYFLQRVKKWTNLAPIFDPTRITSALVSKWSKKIENLKTAQYAQMIGLNSENDIILSLYQFLQKVKFGAHAFYEVYYVQMQN